MGRAEAHSLWDGERRVTACQVWDASVQKRSRGGAGSDPTARKRLVNIRLIHLERCLEQAAHVDSNIVEDIESFKTKPGDVISELKDLVHQCETDALHKTDREKYSGFSLQPTTLTLPNSPSIVNS